MVKFVLSCSTKYEGNSVLIGNISKTIWFCGDKISGIHILHRNTEKTHKKNTEEKIQKKVGNYEKYKVLQ